MALPRNTRNAVTRQSATTSSAKTTTAPIKKQKDVVADVEIISIDAETSTYIRKSDGKEQERQTGVGFCPAINGEVIITRTLTDAQGNDKIEMTEDNIGQTYSAIINRVALKSGGYAFYAEISLSRVQKATDESLNLYDALLNA